jgi:hypothetical protein
MKLYTDFSGKFQMYIPLNWEYKNPSFYRKTEEGSPQAFGFYDKSLGAFQLSCKKVTEHIKNLIATRREPIQSSDSEKLIFTEQLLSSDEQIVYGFSCAVDDHYFFATYIVKPKKSTLKRIDIELQEVRKVLSSVKFIKEPYREIILTQRRFDLYMSSIATIMALKNNAVDRESYIEYVVFTANHIDALLRLSIILTNQISNRDQEIDLKLLFQSESDRPIMERAIYHRCLDLKIISTILFNELENLYKERNKVIHRFIITDIRTEDILKLAVDYGKAFDKVDNIISTLEEEQIKLGIGVWGKNPRKVLTEEEKELMKTKIRDKQGRLPKKK